MIRIFVIGKKHASWVHEGIGRYQKRLTRPWNVEWVLLPHSSFEGHRARQEESERVLARLGATDYVLLLDEIGLQFDSPELSRRIVQTIADGKSITIIIGGAYGVNEALRQRADLVWSLSPLVFPHQLVRLLLIEQLYRAQQIAKSGSYHHE